MMRSVGLQEMARKASSSPTVNNKDDRRSVENKEFAFHSFLEALFPAKMYPVSQLHLQPGKHNAEMLNTDRDTGWLHF